MAEKDQLKCNRTEVCTLCKGSHKRRRRQTSNDKNDVFFICPFCDAPSPSLLQKGR